MGLIDLSKYRALVQGMPVGKRLPDAVYIHSCVLSELPTPYAELVEHAARFATASPDAFNVIKFATGSPRISLLSYARFFEAGFPVLQRSWAVDLEARTSTATS